MGNGRLAPTMADEVTRARSPHRDVLMSGGGAPTCTELRSVIDPALLSYHLACPSRRGSADLGILAEAYRVWVEVWRQTFFELDQTHSVSSDNFSRQDEVGALFHGSECVGLTAYRWVDTADPIDRDDSYFAVWPREAFQAAAAFGTRLCICSNLTVAPAWRGNGGQVKELLGALAIGDWSGPQRGELIFSLSC